MHRVCFLFISALLIDYLLAYIPKKKRNPHGLFAMIDLGIFQVPLYYKEDKR